MQVRCETDRLGPDIALLDVGAMIEEDCRRKSSAFLACAWMTCMNEIGRL